MERSGEEAQDQSDDAPQATQDETTVQDDAKEPSSDGSWEVVEENDDNSSAQAAAAEEVVEEADAPAIKEAEPETARKTFSRASWQRMKNPRCAKLMWDLSLLN